MIKKNKARTLTKSTRQIKLENHNYDQNLDKQRKAMAPGKRISKNGNIYYEYRKNRTDVKGRDTPTQYTTKVSQHNRTLSNGSKTNVSEHKRTIKSNLKGTYKNPLTKTENTFLGSDVDIERYKKMFNSDSKIQKIWNKYEVENKDKNDFYVLSYINNRYELTRYLNYEKYPEMGKENIYIVDFKGSTQIYDTKYANFDIIKGDGPSKIQIQINKIYPKQLRRTLSMKKLDKEKSKESKRKVQIKSITIKSAEGRSELVRKLPITFEGENAIAKVNGYFKYAQKFMPEDQLGYNKQDFEIIYNDGFVYSGRYDLKKNENPDLSKHVKGFVESLIKNENSQEAKDFLQNYELDKNGIIPYNGDLDPTTLATPIKPKSKQEEGFKGSKKTKNMNIKEIAKLVRQEIKQKYPNIKTSVKIKRYSGGQSIDILIKDLDFNPFSDQLMQYNSIQEWFNNVQFSGYDYRYNERFNILIKNILKIAQQYNYDNRFYAFVELDEKEMEKKYILNKSKSQNTQEKKEENDKQKINVNVKEIDIKSTLEESWNGVAVNGAKYTQWKATSDFFDLWKQNKEEIKNKGFNLYKDDSKGWVVTLFGVSQGNYNSYEEYINRNFENMKESALEHVYGYEGGMSKSDMKSLEKSIEKSKNIDELYDVIRIEANNPEVMWKEILLNSKPAKQKEENDIPTPDPEKVAKYKEKIEAKKEKYLNKAAKNYSFAKSNSLDKIYGEENTGIPFGQPILVGHHSEKRHRKHLERLENRARKGFEAQNKADYYKGKAESVGTAGISSDDPEAVIKLVEKLEKLEKKREDIKEFNKKARKEGKEKAPAYMLQNLAGNIRNTKLRIEELKKKATQETKEYEINGIKIVEDTDDNRLKLYFNSIPSEDIRQKLKSRGFKWSRYNKAWQRQLNNNSKFALKQFLKDINNNE